MLVLAIDTALAACSVAFADDDRVLARNFAPLRRGHAERLMPMLQDCRREAGLDYAELDLIAVTVGPGTFTGVRIGLAAARGLALACGCPVLGVGSLQALAWAVPEPAPVLAAIDARRSEIYWQAFGPERSPRTPPALATAAEVTGTADRDGGVLVGSGGGLLLPDLPGWRVSSAPPDPDAATIAVNCHALGPVQSAAAPPLPLYLRAPDAKLPAGSPT